MSWIAGVVAGVVVAVAAIGLFAVTIRSLLVRKLRALEEALTEAIAARGEAATSAACGAEVSRPASERRGKAEILSAPRLLPYRDSD